MRLMPENITRVTIGLIFISSAIKPTSEAIAPIKATYIRYLMVVASELKVHFALTKKEKVTAKQKATRLDKDCVAPWKNMTAKTAQ